VLKRVAYLEDELMTFLENRLTTITQPKVTKKHLAEVANASTQTEKKIAAEKMEIDQEEAMDQVFFSENEDILDQNVFCEKDRQGRDEG